MEIIIFFFSFLIVGGVLIFRITADTQAVAMFVVLMLGIPFFFVIGAFCLGKINNTQTTESIDTQGIYINENKVTTQEETVDSQDNSYSILISGTAISPQNINLNDCDFSVDAEARKITISEKGTETRNEDAKPYEIHIDGSNINIENLDLNDFAIAIDEGNRWIVLTEKE